MVLQYLQSSLESQLKKLLQSSLESIDFTRPVVSIPAVERFTGTGSGWRGPDESVDGSIRFLRCEKIPRASVREAPDPLDDPSFIQRFGEVKPDIDWLHLER